MRDIRNICLNRRGVLHTPVSGVSGGVCNTPLRNFRVLHTCHFNVDSVTGFVNMKMADDIFCRGLLYTPRKPPVPDLCCRFPGEGGIRFISGFDPLSENYIFPWLHLPVPLCKNTIFALLRKLSDLPELNYLKNKLTMQQCFFVRIRSQTLAGADYGNF